MKSFNRLLLSYRYIDYLALKIITSFLLNFFIKKLPR